MSKVMVFMGSQFYPNGGWEDFEGYFDSIEQAKDFINSNDDYLSPWAHIVYENKIIMKAYRNTFPEPKEWKFEGV